MREGEPFYWGGIEDWSFAYYDLRKWWKGITMSETETLPGPIEVIAHQMKGGLCVALICQPMMDVVTAPNLAAAFKVRTLVSMDQEALRLDVASELVAEYGVSQDDALQAVNNTTEL